MSESVISASGLRRAYINQVESLIRYLAPWPFAQWGLDIVGPFPKAVGNKKYLLVGTDYFTK